MAIEPRQPPSQFVAKLQRALGGSAGWSGFVFQILFVAVLAWLTYEIVANARANLQAQRIAAGFGFLGNTAGFDINQSLISYTGSDTYGRVFVIGLLNTLLVSAIGIFFATIIGFLVALGRLSPNWLLSRISGGYVEGVRNLPQILKEVKGIGAIWAGSGDLAMELGVPGNMADPRVEECYQQILKACKEANVPCACIAFRPEDVEKRIEQGFAIIITIPTLVDRAFEAGKKLVRR